MIMSKPVSKSVLITGASSGIGRACATLLARRGFRVFAGVRTIGDGDALRAEGGDAVTPLQIDVTDDAIVDAAAETVRAELDGRGLDGLVNNAGIGTTSPVEYITAEALRRQFDVNVFGQVLVTQAFLPLVRRARGRIVNMGSVGSEITIPFGGALCASKSALKSLNDALRLELRPFGIHVILVEPGAVHTPAADKTLGDIEAVIGALPPEGAARYGDMLRTFARRGYAREINGSPPEVVARVVHRALTAPRPRTRYTVGADAKTMATLPRVVPERLLDLLRLRQLGLSTEFGSRSATQ
jgi:NAD(P)-dependent dehydrogenase (short-subunit alcohol dehydrogenase family)